jgi:hypothetical protein
MFSTSIRDREERISSPSTADLERFLSRMTFDSDYFLDVDGDAGMDGGITLHGATDGIALIGSEDSLRGCFAFLFVDPCRPFSPRTVSIHDLSDANICDSHSSMATIVRTYAESGDLDRNFFWSLNISHDNAMEYNCRLDSGDRRPLAVILERGRDLPRWPRYFG